MEIIFYVLEDALEYKDSMRNDSVIFPSDCSECLLALASIVTNSTILQATP
jgi:hypothetical protein